MSDPRKEKTETDVIPLRKKAPPGRPLIGNLGKHAEKIRAFRIASGMSQAQLAEKVGVSNSAVTNWENGYTRPDIESIIKMCAILSVSSDEILGITDFGKRPTPSEQLMLDCYRALSAHDRAVVNKLMDAMHEERYNEFKRTYKHRFLHRALSPLSACAGTGVDLSGAGEGERVLLRTCDESVACDEIIPICGDSMEPVYHDGDRVLVARTDSLAPGEVGIFVVAGEGMIKVYQKDGLHSLNPAYQTIHPTEADDARCYGRVLCTLTEDMLATKDEQIMIDEINAETRK